MSYQINIKSLKKRKLIELLLKTTDKRRYHYLYLATCYFSPESARTIINEINNSVYLHKVYIYIDRKTAISIGKNELNRYCNSFRNSDVALYAVDTSNLFHSKAYAIISYDDEDEIFCGSLVISSANLTGQGLINRSGNIESMLDTQDICLLSEFTEQLDSLKTVSIEDIERFTNSEEYNFKHALLNEGFFVHKWLDSLGQHLSVRYHLNENGKQRIGDDVFRNTGFNIETATISKRYFQFNYDPPHLENTENLTRKYGIETYLGYWLPSKVLDTMFEKSEFDRFCSELKKQLNIQMESIKEKITNDLNFIKLENIIQVTDSNPVELFQNKASELFLNDLKLKRIYSKYEIFSLPYDINQRIEIEELFEGMISLSESRRRKNTTMKAIMEAISTVSLGEFRKIIIDSMKDEEVT